MKELVIQLDEKVRTQRHTQVTVCKLRGRVQVTVCILVYVGMGGPHPLFRLPTPTKVFEEKNLKRYGKFDFFVKGHREMYCTYVIPCVSVSSCK